MRKILTAVVAAAAIGTMAVATSSTANAWGRWGWGWGPGPFIAGAIVGGAIAAAPYYYRPYNPYYYPYYRPYPYYAAGCGRPVWNGYNWVRAYC